MNGLDSAARWAATNWIGIQWALSFSLGLLLGSFYTALSSRILRYCYGPLRKAPHRWRNILLKPSHCFECGQRLNALELIPILGYLTTRGRCSHCGSAIGWRTLFGECCGGILALVLQFGGAGMMEIFFALCLSGHLLVAASTDWTWLRLDHENTMFALLFAAALVLERSQQNWRLFIEQASIGAGFMAVFALLSMLSRWRGLGLGDAPLAGAAGLALGFPWSLIAVQLAALAALLYIVFVARNLRAPAPLGAALALSTVLLLPAPLLWSRLSP
ncbi:MAG: prepilin peptidase [Leptospirales bacterium]|nr:prepilin peptidase [Leptospirales bacterium]